MLQSSLIKLECSLKKIPVSPFRAKENLNFSKDLRLQVLSKLTKPYLDRPNLDEYFPKNSNDFSDNSAFLLEKNDCSIEIPKNVENSFLSLEKEEEVKEPIVIVNAPIGILTQSTQSLEDLCNFSSDGQSTDKQKAEDTRLFTRKTQKKNMTLILEPGKLEGSEKKKKHKHNSSLRLWKEKRGILKKLEENSKLIGKVSLQLKELIEEEYSKGSKRKFELISF